MPELNLFLIFIERFNLLEINYIVTGSIAAVIYGEPRVTHDIDLVIELKKDDDIRSIFNAFPQQSFYCPPFEIIKLEINRSQRVISILFIKIQGLKRIYILWEMIKLIFAH